MIDLKEISQKLITTDEELANALTNAFKYEVQYTTRYNQLLMENQGLATQVMREAVALEALKQEDIYLEYQEAKLKCKILYSRKDTLMQISKNLINLKWEEVN